MFMETPVRLFSDIMSIISVGGLFAVYFAEKENKAMKIIKNLLPIIIVLIFSSLSILPFLHSGFFPMHDDTQVARVFEMAKSLSSGMFPVRWSYGFRLWIWLSDL